MPVLLKQRNLLDINSVERYFGELKLRVTGNQKLTEFQ